MKKIIFLISLVGLSLHAQTNVTSKNISNFNYQVAEENVIKTLSYLTSDELEGRDSGSEGIEKASIYLENLLKENGIKPYFKTYRDTLSNFDKTSYNIVGYIEGTDKKLKNEFEIFINSFEMIDNETDKKYFQIGAIDAMYYVWLENFRKNNIIKITYDIEEIIKKDIADFQKTNRSTTSKDSIEKRIEIVKRRLEDEQHN